jgi:hypothetical protein
MPLTKIKSLGITDGTITSTNILDGTIVNADINASAAIASTKLSGVTSEVKAWINFNGTGTPSIRASLNVSSITDNGSADYTVNFTTALTDANYAVAGDGAVSGTTLNAGQYNRGPTLVDQALSSSSFRFRTSQLWTTSPEELGLITYIVTR